METFYDLVYFFVTSSEKYGDDYDYHKHFFEGGAFGTGLGIAAGIALLLVVIYYYVIARKHHSSLFLEWCCLILVSGVLTFFATDSVLIGSDDESSATYDTSFYYDLENNYTEMTQDENSVPATEMQEMNNAKNDIIEDLNQGEDVALAFNLSSAIWSMLFFYLFSLIAKVYHPGRNARDIPH